MCNCDKSLLNDAEGSATFILKPKSHEEANSILSTVFENLQNPIIKKDMERFIANATLAEKTNFLNSRAYQLPPTNGHSEADLLMDGCEQVCEDVCNEICKPTTDDPNGEVSCHMYCRKVCSCVTNQ